MKTAKDFTEALALIKCEKELKHMTAEVQAMALEVEIAKLGQMELILLALKKEPKGK